MSFLFLNKSCSGTEVNNLKKRCFECFHWIRAKMAGFQFNVIVGSYFLEVSLRFSQIRNTTFIRERKTSK